MRSLKLKLTLAFLFVSLISAAILAAVVGQTNTSEFNRFVTDQMRSEFIAQAAQHYQNTGSWAGLADRYKRTEPSQRTAPQPPDPCRHATRRLSSPSGATTSSSWPTRPARWSSRPATIASATGSPPSSWSPASP